MSETPVYKYVSLWALQEAKADFIASGITAIFARNGELIVFRDGARERHIVDGSEPAIDAQDTHEYEPLVLEEDTHPTRPLSQDAIDAARKLATMIDYED